MKTSTSIITLTLPLLLLAGCTTVPTGPNVMVMPGSGKNFAQFQADDLDCRQFAQFQIGDKGTNQFAVDAGVSSAVVGTVVGALAGAAIGGHNGAAVGAGTGLLFGSMAGTSAAQTSAYGAQRQYDNAYIQCMYTKGDQVPVAQSQARSRQTAVGASIPPPPPPGYMAPPPPPPGSPPPAPPDSVLR